MIKILEKIRNKGTQIFWYASVYHNDSIVYSTMICKLYMNDVYYIYFIWINTIWIHKQPRPSVPLIFITTVICIKGDQVPPDIYITTNIQYKIVWQSWCIVVIHGLISMVLKMLQLYDPGWYKFKISVYNGIVLYIVPFDPILIRGFTMSVGPSK